jgi:Zn-dependent protease
VPKLSVGNIRVKLEPSAGFFFAIMATASVVLLGWSKGVVAAAIITASVLLHECGHACISRFYGVKVEAVGISFKGAYTIRGRCRRVSAEALTILAGPCVNWGLYVLFAHIEGKAAAWIALMNLVLLVFNLIPLGPSDGYRLWRLLAFGSFGPSRAELRPPLPAIRS